jgi:hypothetical protein
VTQCELSGIVFVETLPTADALTAEYALVMDAIFGFSFKRSGVIRAPFDAILATLAATEARELPDLDFGPARCDTETKDSAREVVVYQSTRCEVVV